MRWLELLRALAYTGIGLNTFDRELEVDAPAGTLTASLLDGLRFNRLALLVSVPPAAIRRDLDIPDDVPIRPVLAVALLWLDAERNQFTDAERFELEDRTRALMDADVPPYVATLIAIEHVVRCRPRTQADAMFPMGHIGNDRLERAA